MTINTIERERLLSIEEYYKMAEVGIIGPTDRVELIAGKIITMSPIGSSHLATMNRINRLFSDLFRGTSIVQVQGPINLPPHSQPEPNVILLAYRADFYEHELPEATAVQLIVEVSKSTLQFDRSVKVPLYAEVGIPEYWIVNLPDQQIEVYRQPSGQSYLERHIAQKGEAIHCLAQPDVTIKVEEVLL